LSVYAFFANKNDEPDLLMEAAERWIKTHALNHFEKASKIRHMIQSGLLSLALEFGTGDPGQRWFSGLNQPAQFGTVTV
jgi:hypothetical protein